MFTIAFTAHNRVNLMQQVIDSWQRVRGIEEHDVLFRCEPGCPEMQELCEPHGDVFVNPHNYGALHNPWATFESGFERSDFVILAEDDSIVSTDILEYMQWAQRFKDDENVLAVCAFQGSEVPGEEHDAYLSDHFTPTIWATWKDRWVNVLRDTWDHDYSTGEPPGYQCGWDWNINLRVKQHRTFVTPSKSRSQHIGREGAHMRPDMFEELQSPNFVQFRPQGNWRQIVSWQKF